MRLTLCTCGLPGPAYHGGAVTCWAIVRAAVSMGHRISVLSLFDTSSANPYLNSRQEQHDLHTKLGVSVKFVEFDLARLKRPYTRGSIARTVSPLAEELTPLSLIRNEAEKRLAETNPEATFVYHFDALSGLFGTKVSPIFAGVGDLWHLPGMFNWEMSPFSLRKYSIGLLGALVKKRQAEVAMVEMLKQCQRAGAFAAHYAQWLTTQLDRDHSIYLRTPAHDPVKSDWRNLRDQGQSRNSIPRILMIGDIAGTAARGGLRILGEHIVPALLKEFGPNGFEIHLVGGGQLEPSLQYISQFPCVKVRGRVTPPDEEFLRADILLVPTPFTLGIRVRIITGFSYGSCILTHEANAAGIPEIQHESNALVGRTGSELAQLLIRAVADKTLRTKLEAGARKTFEDHFAEDVAGRAIVSMLETTRF
jgi:hypothetical protein